MARTSSPPLLMRIDEAATRLAISRATIYRLIQKGTIPTIHIGASVRVPVAALERWVQSQVADGAEEGR